jgi:PAS domain S-box-containing protein
VGKVGVRPWYDKTGAIGGIVISTEDVTERKRVEEALRRSEDEFRTMANAIPQLAWIANTDGWIYGYNEGWYKYTGTTPSQMEGWGWQAVHDPVALPAVMERWQKSIATCEPFEMTFPLRGTDGAYRAFLTRATPLKDESGRVQHWFGTNTDAEEQKLTEERLCSYGEELQALTMRLQDVPEEERTRVSRDLHDDIGQILTSVKMGLASIQKHLPQPASELHARIKAASDLLSDGVKSVRKICTGFTCLASLPPRRSSSQ